MTGLPDDMFPDAPPAPPAVYLDRSTLERYAVCPFQGWAVETGKVMDGSPAADTGSENHRIVAEAIADYFLNGIPPLDYLRQEMTKARPDVQQEVVASLRRSAWAVNQYLTSMHPRDILAFQGGPKEWVNPSTNETENRSGQLAWQILPATKKRGAIMATSEVDLLVAGTTQVEVNETDFKYRKAWTSTEIRASFQFRMHAFLVFRKYPKAEYLHTRAWPLATGQVTPWVTFTPRDANDFEGVLLEAVEYRRGAMESETPGTWPAAEKCTTCPAVLVCPRAIKPAYRLNENPFIFAADTHVMKLALAEREKHLRKYINQHGDIIGDEVAYGLRGPRAPRKPDARSYTWYTPPEKETEVRK